MRIKQRAVVALTTLGMGAVIAAGQAAPAGAEHLYGGITVKGRIEQAYLAAGGPNRWGNPVTGELRSKNNGRFQVFSRDASFYWNAGVDNGFAHQVGGAIRAEWGALNWENGPLGYPLTNEYPDGVGRLNRFEGGIVYWSAATGAHQVWGGILSKWRAQGGPRSPLGLPVANEVRTGRTFHQNFQNGVLYWP